MVSVVDSICYYSPETKPRVYTPSELESRFKKLRYVGSGGEGCIYEVEEKSNGFKRVLKIANNNWSITEDNERVAKIVSVILKEGISPHLTLIHELLTVKCAVFAHSSYENTGSFFNGASKYEGEGDGTFPRRAMLMELLEGDLRALGEKYFKKELSQAQWVAFRIQVLSIDFILTQQGFRIGESLKPKNILYKTLESKDLFQGKPLIDFDVWKYVFGEHTFYLPAPKYLVKLADYDPWITTSPTQNLEAEKFIENGLKNSLSEEKLTFAQVKDWFKKPENPDAKILEVYDSSNLPLHC